MKSINIRKYLYIIPIGFSLSIICNLLLIIFDIERIFPGGTEVTEKILDNNYFISIILGGVITPTVEEVIFRGLIYKKIKIKFNKIIAMIASALLFAIIHGNVAQGMYAFISSFVFIYLYDECDNIFAPIFAHIIANTTILLFGIIGGDFNSIIFMHKILLLIICVVIFSMSIYRFRENKD